jgi:DNA polymerase-1
MDPTTKQVDRPWRLCIRKPFLPNSTDHIIRYMKFRGHPVPRTFKEERETTEAVELERLAKRTRDTMYTRILDYRRIAKMKSTYVDGWKPGADGRVHTQFTFRPATGQLSSRNPNAQNTPKRAALASRFNEILEAPPGYKLVEIDYSSFHVLTTGYEAKDPVYYRMARLDPHSFLASYMRSVNRPIDPSLPDEQILRLTSEIKKEFKSVRNNQAKPGILGYGFGLGINNFYNQNIEHFRNRAEAQEVYDLLDRLFPVAKKWRDQIRKQAHSQGYLISKHGYIRHFHEVYKWDPKRQGLVPGNDSEAAIAFLPANDAFGHIKEAMLRVEEMGANERYGFVNQIHDSLMFCCPDRLVMECLKVVSREMLRPSTYLADPILCPEGLWCGVEAGVGQCRAAMEGVSLERIWEVAA